MVRATSKASDQPAPTRSLIRAFGLIFLIKLNSVAVSGIVFVPDEIGRTSLGINIIIILLLI